MVARLANGRKLSREPSSSTTTSDTTARPTLGADFYTFENQSYLVLSDYFSCWKEMKYLRTTAASAVINKMKQVFATHGIPDVIVSDNGPQFACNEFMCLPKNMVSSILPAVHISNKATGLQRVQ